MGLPGDIPLQRALTATGIVALLFISALYPTIFLHEIAHAAAAFQIGCKADWWSTDTTLLLYRSFGGDIDYECLARTNNYATAIVDAAGVIANLIAMGVALIASYYSQKASTTVWLISFAAMNHIEAFSYLIFNVLIPRSDMIAIIDVLPVQPWLLAGLSIALSAVLAPSIFVRLKKLLATRFHERSILVATTIGALLIACVMLMGRSDLTDGATSLSQVKPSSVNCEPRLSFYAGHTSFTPLQSALILPEFDLHETTRC